jgi:hypothetical protein
VAKPETFTDTPVGKVKDGDHAEVLEEMLKRYQRDTDEWEEIRAEGTTDMRYVSGDPWDATDRRMREDAGRPVLSFDESGQYVNQLINEIRQHKRAIQVTPIGAGATDAIAELRGNLIRQIEYRSNAQQAAYTPMFENTVQRSYGFMRVKAQYVHNPEQSGGNGQSFDQELILEGLPNPDLVTVDCDITKPDGSDMGHAWIAESWALSDYKKKWPKAKVRDFSPEFSRGHPTAWQYTASRIQIAEYWRIESEDRKLLLFTVDGQRAMEVFEDDLKLPAWEPIRALMESNPDFKPSRERVVERPVVKHFMTNGFEVLGQETDWPGDAIPLVCCFGKILWVDEGSGPKRKVLSLIRLARDPMMLLSYYVSCEAELIGMTPKVPYFVRRGSLKDDELLLLQKSLHEPVAVIQVETTTPESAPGVVLDFPQRNPYEPPIQAIEVGKEAARRAIQSAMGINPLPTNAQRKNDKSGVALKEIRNAEQQGSFHFIDSYEAAITRGGAIVNQLLPYYYDTARDVTVRTAANEAKVLRINDPQGKAPGQDEPLMLSPEGKFDVTLDTGPDFASEREAASAFVDTLVASNMPQAQAILPLLVKLKNLGPIGQEIYDVLVALSPPPVQAVLKKGQDGQPTVPELMHQLDQAKQALEQMQQQLQQATMELQTEAVKGQRDAQIAQFKAQSDAQVKIGQAQADMASQLRDLEVKLEIELAKIGSAMAMARGEQEMQLLHHHDDVTLQREQMAQASAQQTLDREAAQQQAAQQQTSQGGA